MLFDLTFLCYLITISGKKRLSGKVICAFFCPAYRSSSLQITLLKGSSYKGHFTLQVTAFLGRGGTIDFVC
jgi:hypothetical protein